VLFRSYLEEGLQLDSKTGRVGLEIIATLLGGTLNNRFTPSICHPY